MIVLPEDEYNAWEAIDDLLDQLLALDVDDFEIMRTTDGAGRKEWNPSRERKAVYRLLAMQRETLHRARARERESL